MLKNPETRTGSEYYSRAHKRPDIKKQRIKFFKSLVGEEGASPIQDFELERREFIVLAILYRVNLNNIIQFLDHALQYEGIFVTVAYILLEATLGMPLFQLYTFMSSYSKKSYITFWDCVPVLEGLGLTVAVISFVGEFFNIVSAGLSLILIPDVFNNRVMNRLKSCNNGTDKDLCIPMRPKEPYTAKTCPESMIRKKEETVFVATQYYLRYDVMQYDQFDLTCCKINVKWTISVLIVWIIVFFTVILGIKRIRKFTINFQYVFSAILCIIGVLALLGTETFRVEFNWKTAYSAISSFSFWLQTLQQTGQINIFGNILWLGAIKPKDLNPSSAALIVCALKLVTLILTLCWSSRIIDKVRIHYKFHDGQCLFITGFDLMFAFVPDLLHGTSFGKFLVMFWYLGLFYFGIITPIYSIIGLVDSLSQKYKVLNKYRLFVYLVLCISGYLICLCLTQNLSLSVISTFKTYGLTFLYSTILLTIALALMFLYSSKRIVDDYHFTYGSPPHKYWGIFWKTSPILAIFGVIMMFTQMKTDSLKAYTNPTMITLSYVLSAGLFLPLIVMFMSKCCKHVKYRTLSSLTRPSYRWGPYGAVKKQARKLFYPHRDIKYRNNFLKCTHVCIADSDVYYEENRRQKIKLQELLNEMGNRKMELPASEILFEDTFVRE